MLTIAAESRGSASGFGWTVGAYAALAGAAVVVLAAGGWYARTRCHNARSN